MTVLVPVLIGLAYAGLNSLIRAEHRRPFNAIVVAGAGAAYLGGPLGLGEVAFTVVLTYVAYRGLQSWGWIGVAWLLHTVWDVVHHLQGAPILPFAHDSSLGCAICDPVIAAWCFLGGPSVRELGGRLRLVRDRVTGHGPGERRGHPGDAEVPAPS